MTSNCIQIHLKCETSEGSQELQKQLKSLCGEYIGIFSTSARAQVEPMVIEIDGTKREVPRNPRFPPRHHSAEKQVAI